MNKGDRKCDPKGLIYESYRIDGISISECRTIFLDWALSLPDGIEMTEALHELISTFGVKRADHPMTILLREGLTSTPNRHRRSRRRTLGRRREGSNSR